MPIKKVRKSQGDLTSQQIIIDPTKGWVFQSEDELYAHFKPQIDVLEKEYQAYLISHKSSVFEPKDIDEKLNDVLESPDEVWEHEREDTKMTLYYYTKIYDNEKSGPIGYVAITYVVEQIPVFVFLHFATLNMDHVQLYRRGECVYNKMVSEVNFAIIEGDALGDADPLALGLLQAMLKLRSENDISNEDFKNYADLRESTIQEPDEIWRTSDLDGNILVTFIRDYTEEQGSLVFYIVVTLEEPSTNVHELLFSFPTQDKNLLERYRHGENLQAEEVSQEASH